MRWNVLLLLLVAWRSEGFRRTVHSQRTKAATTGRGVWRLRRNTGQFAVVRRRWQIVPLGLFDAEIERLRFLPEVNHGNVLFVTGTTRADRLGLRRRLLLDRLWLGCLWRRWS